MVLANLALFQAAIFPQGKFPCTANPDGTLNVNPNCEVTLPATSPIFARSYRYHDWAVYAQGSGELRRDSLSTTAHATSIMACSTTITSNLIPTSTTAPEPTCIRKYATVRSN